MIKIPSEIKLLEFAQAGYTYNLLADLLKVSRNALALNVKTNYQFIDKLFILNGAKKMKEQGYRPSKKVEL